MPPQFASDLGVLSVAALHSYDINSVQLQEVNGNHWVATKLAMREAMMRGRFPRLY